MAKKGVTGNSPMTPQPVKKLKEVKTKTPQSEPQKKRKLSEDLTKSPKTPQSDKKIMKTPKSAKQVEETNTPKSQKKKKVLAESNGTTPKQNVNTPTQNTNGNSTPKSGKAKKNAKTPQPQQQGTPKAAPTQTPKQTPKAAPAQSPKQTPKKTPKQTPKQTPTKQTIKPIQQAETPKTSDAFSKELSKDFKIQQDQNNRTLFVRPLLISTTEEELMTLGTGIVNASLRHARAGPKKERGHAILEFKTEALANQHHESLKGFVFKGLQITTVDFMGEKSKNVKVQQGAVIRPDEVHPQKLFIKTVGKGTTEEQLSAHFSTASQVLIPLRGKDKKPLGFGFVNFNTEEACREAHAKLQGTVVNGQKLELMFAKRRPQAVEKQDKAVQEKAKKRAAEAATEAPKTKKSKKEAVKAMEVEEEEDDEDDDDEDDDDEDDEDDDDEDDDDDEADSDDESD